MVKAKELIRQFVRDTARYNNLYPNSNVDITIPANDSYDFTINYLSQYTKFFVQFKFSNVISANLTISDGTNSETATYEYACGILINDDVTTITITNNETFDIKIDGIAYYNLDNINFDDYFIGSYIHGFFIDTIALPEGAIAYWKKDLVDEISYIYPEGYEPTQIYSELPEFIYSQTEIYTIDGSVFKPNQFFAYIIPFISFKKFIGDFYLGGFGTDYDIISASQISGSTYGVVPAFDISGVNLSNLRVLTQSTNGFSAKISQVGSNPNEIEIITYKNGQPTAVDTLTKFILKVA